jgi:2-polyprenyl-3-methyl-5-hydroxy-6-metoxy-1,4-benzoquinol methylase
LDEQAGPAYLEGLALSRSIFWSRLNQVIRLLPTRGSACLDFGCGFGLLLPLLSRRFDQLVGVDLMPDLARGFLQQWTDDYDECLPEIEIVSTLEAALPGVPLDLMLALDVLEHVDNLDSLLAAMADRLRPNGLIVVSGPTESWLYRLGRKIVGFSGDYHVRDIHDIRGKMNEHFDVQTTRRLPRLAPLFHIITATPRK